jgi:hypothetical protein
MKVKINGRTVKLPDFLIVGAARSGTSSLYYYLKQHPKIFMPEIKEPNFFSYREVPPFKKVECPIIREFNEYIELFEPAKEDQIIGEASVSYLRFYNKTIENIKNYIPEPQNLKIIIILRNPIDRVFSSYCYKRYKCKESLDLEEAIKPEVIKERIADNWGPDFDYIEWGFVSQGVRAYLNHFQHVRIYLYENLIADPSGLVKDIFRFLEVDDSFTPDVSKKHNPSGIPRIEALQKFLKKPNFLSSIFPFIKLIPVEKRAEIVEKIMRRNSKKLQMKEDTREHLKELFKEEILSLQELIGKDLSGWLK